MTAVDLRGHGDSPRAGASLTLDDLGRDLIETVGVEPLELVVGHSLGALAVMSAVGQRPQLAPKIVLEEPPGIASVDRALLAALIADDLQRVVDQEAFVARTQQENPKWHQRDVLEAVEGLMKCEGAAIVRAVGNRELDWDLAVLAAGIQAPTLVLTAVDTTAAFGSESGGSALNGDERAAFIEALRDARHLVVDGGHSIHRSEPELWLDAVTSFASGA